MKWNFFTYVLLAILAFSLWSGPHPCRASHEEGESRHASCHRAMGSSNGPELRSGAPFPKAKRDCCGTFCEHACHMTAIADSPPLTFAITPVSQATVEAAGYGLPLFVHPIDHVPLA